MVSHLVDLYLQQDQFDQLIDRLRRPSRATADPRTSALLVSEAYRVSRDVSSARQVLEPILADRPRDTELLMQMVALSRDLDDLQSAIAYQKQLTTVTDTAENRNVLFSMLIDAGRLDEAEGFLPALDQADDVAALLATVDRAIGRNDIQTAIRLSRTMLKKRDDLWEVKTRLAGLLIRHGQFNEAIRLADQVRELPLQDDAQPISQRAGNGPGGTGPPNTLNSRSPDALRIHDRPFVAKIAAFLAPTNVVNPFGGQVAAATIDIENYSQAKFISLGVKLYAAVYKRELGEFFNQNRGADQDLLKSADKPKLWDVRDRLVWVTSGSVPVTESMRSRCRDLLNQIVWRLAELDPDGTRALVASHISDRASAGALLRSYPSSAQSPHLVEPLTDAQADLLLRNYKQQHNEAASAPAYLSPPIVYRELLAAGRIKAANAIIKSYDTGPDSIVDAIRSLEFFNSISERRASLQTMKHAHAKFANWSAVATPLMLESLYRQSLTAARASAQSEQLEWAVDMMIALEAIRKNRSPSSGTPTGVMPSGVVASYTTSGSRRLRKVLTVPFSDALMSGTFAQSFLETTGFAGSSSLQKQWLAHLSKSVSLLPRETEESNRERKLRGILAAYARWWAGSPQDAHDALRDLSQQYPDDADLQIEIARLAVVLKRPNEAVARLDQLDLKNPTSSLRAEWIALGAASQTGDVDRARIAAQRLSQMQLDPTTEMTLVRQLITLSMPDLAAKMLARLSHRKAVSVSGLLSIATYYLKLGDNDAAASAALIALKKSQASGNTRLVESYNRNAVRLLQQTGRLEKLLDDLEARAADSSHPQQLHSELLDIYLALGRLDDARRMLQSIGTPRGKTPRELLQMAQRLVPFRLNDHAIRLYLAAFKRNPSLLSRQQDALAKCLTSGDHVKQVYAEVSTWDVSQIDHQTLAFLTTLYSRANKAPTPEAIAFVDRVMDSATVDSFTGLAALGEHTDFKNSRGMARAARGCSPTMQSICPTASSGINSISELPAFFRVHSGRA